MSYNLKITIRILLDLMPRAEVYLREDAYGVWKSMPARSRSALIAKFLIKHEQDAKNLKKEIPVAREVKIIG